MNYLQIVNTVLRKLREPEVTAVSENLYSKMVGQFVNEAKREVEDAWNWNALSAVFSFNTAAGTTSYPITGSGQRFKVVSFTDSAGSDIAKISRKAMIDQLRVAGQQAIPSMYSFSGVDANGDTQVSLAPVPNAVYSLTMDMIIPQDALSADVTILKIPYEPVVANAYARALVERGEDGGLGSSEAYLMYRTIVSDLIAIEEGRNADETDWARV